MSGGVEKAVNHVQGELDGVGGVGVGGAVCCILIRLVV